MNYQFRSLIYNEGNGIRLMTFNIMEPNHYEPFSDGTFMEQPKNARNSKVKLSPIERNTKSNSNSSTQVEN